MEIQERIDGDQVVLAVSGRLDTLSFAEFEGVLMSHLTAGKTDMELDLSGLDYLSSAGMRVLLKGAKHLAPQHQQIVLSNVQDHIREMLDISGVSELFEIR